jgi:hypothetical protein
MFECTVKRGAIFFFRAQLLLHALAYFRAAETLQYMVHKKIRPDVPCVCVCAQRKRFVELHNKTRKKKVDMGSYMSGQSANCGTGKFVSRVRALRRTHLASHRSHVSSARGVRDN